jgi:hypothetical protein
MPPDISPIRVLVRRARRRLRIQGASPPEPAATIAVNDPSDPAYAHPEMCDECYFTHSLDELHQLAVRTGSSTLDGIASQAITQRVDGAYVKRYFLQIHPTGNAPPARLVGTE